MKTMEENHFLVSCVRKAAVVPTVTAIIHSIEKKWYIVKEEFPGVTRSMLYVITTRHLN